jgi:2-phosphosulfolactate phosphatase
VLVGCVLNLRATAEFIAKEPPANLLLVCSGTYEQAAYEDTLCAGALIDLLWSHYEAGKVADSALLARKLYRLEQNDLFAGMAQSRNGRRLLSQAELRDDVAFCARRDTLDLVARLEKDGRVRRVAGGG